MRLADWALREDIPTRPPQPPSPGPALPWTTREQADHCRALLEALRGWIWEDDDSLSSTRRHLRAVKRGERERRDEAA